MAMIAIIKHEAYGWDANKGQSKAECFIGIKAADLHQILTSQ